MLERLPVSRAFLAVRRKHGGTRGLALKVLDVFRNHGVGVVVLGIRNQIHMIRRGQASDSVPRTEIGSQFEPSHAQRAARPDGRIGVMAHVYYVDLADEMIGYLRNIPWPFTLLVSTVSEADADTVRAKLSQLPLAKAIVRVVPNRGRDIAPFLVGFADAILNLDYVCHLHTKKSLFIGTEQIGWREYLCQALLGSEDRVRAIFAQFRLDPKVGIIYPLPYSAIPYSAYTWYANRPAASGLLARLGIEIADWGSYVDFPAGSMFWARVSAIRRLFDLKLQIEDFPPELGQTDGALQHAIERCFVLVCRTSGYSDRVVAAGGRHRFGEWNHKNVDQYLSLPPTRQRILESAHAASLVSFDIFDTLLLRPFTTPDAVLRMLEERIARELGVHDYREKRRGAESLLRDAKTSGDVKCSEIARMLVDRFGLGPDLAAQCVRIELEIEKAQLQPRLEVVEALREIRCAGKAVVLVSDTELEEVQVREILAAHEIEYDAIYLSSEVGLRKDRDGELYRHILAAEDVERDRYLHVGTDEHTDLQIPASQCYPALHLMRPLALFEQIEEGIAFLRSVRTPRTWQDDLLVGLLANEACRAFDRDPHGSKGRLLFEPERFGYFTFGPMVFQYFAWLVRRASKDGMGNLFFISREGHVLKQLYDRLVAHPAITRDLPRSEALPSSSRAVTFAAIRSLEDLAPLFELRFEGTLGDLLQQRMGLDDLAPFRNYVGDIVLRRRVLLPRDRSTLVERLRPCADLIVALAAQERAAYLSYLAGRLNRQDFALAGADFSGNIQRAFVKMAGRSYAGYYFATTGAVREIDSAEGRTAVCFGENLDSGASQSPVLKYALLLSAALTAPNGPLVRFIDDGASVSPVFKTPGRAQQLFEQRGTIHQGIARFASDLLDVLGDAAVDIQFDPDLVQSPLRLIAERCWRIGPVADLLWTEDDGLGSGELPALEFFTGR